jgi:hypothetical protein
MEAWKGESLGKDELCGEALCKTFLWLKVTNVRIEIFCTFFTLKIEATREENIDLSCRGLTMQKLTHTRTVTSNKSEEA